MKKVFKYSFRTLLIVLLLAVVLFFTALLLIRQPGVQTYVVHKVAGYLSNKIGSEVKIGSVDIKFFKTLQINEVYVADPKKDTILYARELDVRLKFFDFFKKKYHFDNIALDGLVLYGKRSINDSTYNFSYIFEKFSPQEQKKQEKKKSSEPVDLTLNKVQLTNAHLVLDDRYKDMKMELRFKKVFIDVDKLDLKTLTIQADNIELDTPQFTLTQYHDKPPKPKGPPGKGFQPQNMGLTLSVNSIKMNDGLYAMNMEKRETFTGSFQISKMRCNKINFKLNDFSWDSTGMKVEMKTLNALLDNQIAIKEVSGDVLLDNHNIVYKDAHIEYGSTRLLGNFALKFPNSWHDLSDFINSVNMVADLKDVDAKAKDILLFVPPVVKKYIPPSARLQGTIRGRLTNLRIEKMYITAGNNTVIDIEGNIKGLPKVNQTLFDLTVNQVKTNSSDLHQLVTFTKLPAQFGQAGNISFTGTFFGFFNDFVARGKLITSNLGSAETDMRMSFKKGQVPSYDGILKGKNINLAVLANNHKLLKTADLDISAVGQGFDLKTLYTKINGSVNNLYLNGFVFDKIKVSGLIDKKKYSGKAFYDDSCFLIDFNGTADFNDSLPKFDFIASLKNIDLYKLNFTKDTIIISADGEVHAVGNDINTLTGTGVFNHIILQNSKDMLALSAVNANFDNDGSIKNYTIKSKEIDVNVKGKFNPLTIYQSGKVFVSRYTNLFTPTEKDLSASTPQEVDAKIILHTDFGGLFKVFTPKLKYLSELNLDARMNTETGLLEIKSQADSINYDNIIFSGFTLNANTENQNLLGTFQLKKLLYDNIEVREIGLGFNSSSEQLLSNLSVENDSAKNSIRLESAINFKGDSILAHVLDSKLRLNYKDWSIEPGNSLTIIDSTFITQNFNFRQGDQRISFQNGRNTLEDVKVNIENLQLADVYQIFDTSGIVKAGSLSGNVNLKNILTKLNANADITIKGLEVLDYQVDYIGLDGVYGRNGKKIAEVGGTLEDNEYQLSFDGTYDMTVKGSEKLDVDADIQKLSLQFLQDLLKKQITLQRAYVQGQLKATGTIKNIQLTGKATLLDTARIRMSMLGAVFKIPKGEEIIMDKKGFDFGQMTIFDDYNNAALLSGKLEHEGFQNFRADNIFLDAGDGYNFMNTTYQENQDFYGKVFARGTVNVDGPFDDLNIIVDAETMRNTVFNLPVGGATADQKYSYVSFFDPKNDTSAVVEEKVKLSGINLQMNIDASNNAIVNIILDPSSNDVISASGEGHLILNLYSSGQMSLRGVYSIDYGVYNFKFQNIIEKKFSVNKGSTITFTGEDPLKALLNIRASYTVPSVSLRSLDSTLRTPIPVDLTLKITGTLESPIINFDISTSTSGKISASSDRIQSLLSEITKNQNEVNNQAFTLLLFNSFSKIGELGSTGSYSNSLTQFFSDQISKFLTTGIQTFIKGASLDVLLSDLENKESRQFGFSYKQELFNNRLIFTVGGNVNLNNSNNTVQSLNNRGNTAFAGDFVLEYLLTPDGRIRLKTFARTANYDLINQDRVRTGVAIAFQKDFDRFEDIFKRPNKKKNNVVVRPDSTIMRFTIPDSTGATIKN